MSDELTLDDDNEAGTIDLVCNDRKVPLTKEAGKQSDFISNALQVGTFTL